MTVIVGGGALASFALAEPGAGRAADALCPDAVRFQYLNEGFEEAWPPAGWAILTTGLGRTWCRDGSRFHTGIFSAGVRASVGVQQDEWLISSSLDLSDATAPSLIFYEDDSGWITRGDHHYIAVSTSSQSNPAAFTVIADWTPMNHAINGFLGAPVIVDLSPFAGQSTVYVAFRYVGMAADSWFVDDVRVFAASEHDVMAVAALPQGEHVPGGASILPRAVVSNVGLFPETFDVRMAISEAGLPPQYSETVHVPLLGPGDDRTLNYPPVTVNAGNFYELTATTLLASDEDPSNDVAASVIDTYTEPHTPLGVLFTNSGCGPCAPANFALSYYLSTTGNGVALVRVHTWWPNPGDIMFLANVEQCTELTEGHGVHGVPHFFVDRCWDVGSAASQMMAALDEARTWGSPMDIDLEWNQSAELLSVAIDVVNPLHPAGDYRLFCAVTEDSVFHTGGNDESYHMQAFRYMYPDHVEGIEVPSTLGDHRFSIACPLDPAWVYGRLRVSAFVIDRRIHRVWQARMGFLTEIAGTAAVVGTPGQMEIGLLRGQPSPCRGPCTIQYAVDEPGPMTLDVYDPKGRLVTVLTDGPVRAGRGQVVWDPSRRDGRPVPAGVYFLRMAAGGRCHSQRVVVIR